MANDINTDDMYDGCSDCIDATPMDVTPVAVVDLRLESVYGDYFDECSIEHLIDHGED